MCVTPGLQGPSSTPERTARETQASALDRSLCQPGAPRNCGQWATTGVGKYRSPGSPPALLSHRRLAGQGPRLPLQPLAGFLPPSTPTARGFRFQVGEKSPRKQAMVRPEEGRFPNLGKWPLILKWFSLYDLCNRCLLTNLLY